jgi:hypothetical protein
MHRFFIIYTSLVIFALLGFWAMAFITLNQDQMSALATEDAMIESFTAFGFGVVALLAGFIWIKARREIWALFTFFMGLACFRELDLHKAFTSDSFLKLRFYSGDIAPLHEKIVGACAILLIIFCAYRLSKYAVTWIKDIIAFKPQSCAIFLGMGTLGFAKKLDALSRLFPSLSDFHGQNRPFLGLIEESAELASVAFFLCACLLWFKTNRLSRPE